MFIINIDFLLCIIFCELPINGILTPLCWQKQAWEGQDTTECPTSLVQYLWTKLTAEYLYDTFALPFRY